MVKVVIFLSINCRFGRGLTGRPGPGGDQDLILPEHVHFMGVQGVVEHRFPDFQDNIGKLEDLIGVRQDGCPGFLIFAVADNAPLPAQVST